MSSPQFSLPLPLFSWDPYSSTAIALVLVANDFQLTKPNGLFVILILSLSSLEPIIFSFLKHFLSCSRHHSLSSLLGHSSAFSFSSHGPSDDLIYAPSQGDPLGLAFHLNANDPPKLVFPAPFFNQIYISSLFLTGTFCIPRFCHLSSSGHLQIPTLPYVQ